MNWNEVKTAAQISEFIQAHGLQDQEVKQVWLNAEKYLAFTENDGILIRLSQAMPNALNAWKLIGGASVQGAFLMVNPLEPTQGRELAQWLQVNARTDDEKELAGIVWEATRPV